MAETDRRYQILDLTLHIRTDREEWVAPFHQDYGHFQIPATTQPEGAVLPLILLSNQKGGLDIRRGQTLIAELPERLQQLAYVVIKRVVFRALEGYLFFHAAVAARDGRALIISGPPRAGKTTLVLRLLDEGFHFFSDEICPLHLETMLVHPFPRSAWVADGAPGTREKKSLSPSRLGGPVGGAPVPPGALFILDGGLSSNSPTRLQILVRSDKLESFLRDARIEKPKIAAIPDFAYSEVTVPYPGHRGSDAVLIRALDLYRDDILKTEFPAASAFDFGRETDIERISSFQAARLWLTHLVDRAHPILVREPARVMFRLARLLESIPCFRLTPGDLDKTVALVKTAWKEGQP